MRRSTPLAMHDPSPRKGELAEALASIARGPAASFFLTAAWFQACTQSWRGKTGFQLFSLGEPPPAWALLGCRTEMRHGVLPVRVLALNQSVVPELDQPWIERNGFFASDAARFRPDMESLLDQISSDHHWDELRLGGLMRKQADAALALANRFSLHSRLEMEQPVYWIDLQRLRDTGNPNYLATLSSNTRQQLRRSRRLAERDHGELQLEKARTMREALDWFMEAAPLHRARWGGPEGTDLTSGFNNPEFVKFHQGLIAIAFGQGGVQFLRLRAGKRILAYLYSMVSGGHLHFYLSGVDYSVGARYRPGLLAHWLAIEHNLAIGNRLYDFLAGDAQYKRSLATDRDTMYWLVLQRPRWKLKLEDVARRLKQGVQSTVR